MSDDPWVSPVHTTSADENEAYASHPLHAEVAALTAELDRLREEAANVEVATKSLLRGFSEVIDERDTLAAERERANEAARLSAEARDQADELRKGLEDLRDFASILERDRTERDDWVMRVAEEFGLSAGYDDPWGAVPALYYEIEKHMTRAETVIERVLQLHKHMHAGSENYCTCGRLNCPTLAAVDAYQATPATTEREGADPDIMAIQSWDAAERNADDPA
jgi:hypothetical protein